MSNLLTGLALALGGGLQGYARGKEMQRQARMEEEEQAARRKREARQDEISNLNLFAQGFRKRGDGTGDDQGYMTPGTQDAVMRSVEAALAMGGGNYGGMGEAARKLGEATETPWTYGQRRWAPVAGTEYEFDETKGPEYQNALNEERQIGQERRRQAATREEEARKEFAKRQEEQRRAEVLRKYLNGDQSALAELQALGMSPRDLAPVEGSPQWQKNQRFMTDEKIRAAVAEAEARGVGRPRLTATAQRELDNTTAFLAEIDRAIQAIEEAPDAFAWSMGPARKLIPFGQYYGREMDERAPSRIRAARRGYASSISAERLQKAGVATTASEMENLRPYLTETDVVGPKQALENLQNLRRAALEKLNIKRESYGMEPMVPAAAGRVNPYREN